MMLILRIVAGIVVCVVMFGAIKICIDAIKDFKE